MTIGSITLLLAILGSVSPLLTFLCLWQVKEWRRDRLWEHMRREGLAESLLSRSRVTIGGAWIIGGLAVILVANLGNSSLFGVLPFWPIVLPALLTLLGMMQISMKRQPLPVWTLKSQAVFFVGVVINILLGWICLIITATGYDKIGQAYAYQPFTWGILLLPYLQPFIAGLSVALMFPLDHCLKARVMARAKNIRRAHTHLRMIGITGSVGKTTTKELLAHILNDRGAKATPVHVNTEMGVAAWISKILKNEPQSSEQILIVEMGAYRKGEISLLCSIAQPTLGIVTYVGKQHLSLFGNREAIIETKGELFAALPENGHAFLNRDNDAFDALRKRCSCPGTTVGTGNDADITATDIEETGTGIRFRALGALFEVPLSGTHNVASALLSIAVARHLGLNIQEIARQLRTFKPIGGTFEVKTQSGITILNDTYNSSPDSVRAAIDWAARQPQKEKILLMEGIIELGEAEKEIHEELALRASKVFTRAFVADPHFLPFLKQGGFGDRAKPASTMSQSIEAGTLLVCTGRISKSILRRFLPSGT